MRRVRPCWNQHCTVYSTSTLPQQPGTGGSAETETLGERAAGVECAPDAQGGQFKPSLLPAPYPRGYCEKTRQLLLSVRASSGSLSAAKDSIRRLGIGVYKGEIETAAADLMEDFHVINTGSLTTDYLALYLDGIKERQVLGPHTRDQELPLFGRCQLRMNGVRRFFGKVHHFMEAPAKTAGAIPDIPGRSGRCPTCVLHHEQGGSFEQSVETS